METNSKIKVKPSKLIIQVLKNFPHFIEGEQGDAFEFVFGILEKAANLTTAMKEIFGVDLYLQVYVTQDQESCEL
jgi:uncharacterized UBP type Zn finger protein